MTLSSESQQLLPNFFISTSCPALNNYENVTLGNSFIGYTINSTGGVIDSFSITPELEDGLIFDTHTGLISGTPTKSSPPINYTITATNSYGTSTAEFNISVTELPRFTISTDYETVTLGDSVSGYTVNYSSNNSPIVQTFSISPELENGLVFDIYTGIITGKPITIAAPITYTITAANLSGNTSVEYTICVIEPLPSFTISTDYENVQLGNSIVGYTINSTGGVIDSFSISPEVENGLLFDPSTGIIRGIPITLAAPITYTITATNLSGNTSVEYTICVIEPLPSFTISTDYENVQLGNSLVGYSLNFTGGIIDSFSISPEIENGLIFDISTGLITGTPTKLATPLTYTITSTNSSGSFSASYTIIISSSIIFTFESCLNLIEISLKNAENNNSKITDELVNMNCEYVTKFKHFLNNLLSIENIWYLEIGEWNSTSVCSAMCNNKGNIVCIEYCCEKSRDPLKSHENCMKNKDVFPTNLQKFKGENIFHLIEAEYYSIDISKLPKINIFMYDGDKYCRNILNSLLYYYNCLSDTFIFCINTKNYKYINDNIQLAILRLKLKILYESDIVFNSDDLSVCNNIYIAILQK